jgi:hypothetical protein
MALLQTVRGMLADSERPGSLGQRARAKRSDKLMATFPDLASMRVLDLGGGPPFWRGFAVQPAHVTVLNLLPLEAPEPWIETVVGDACAPPSAISAERYDLVVSNSVIEHVGGHLQRQRFADVVQAAAERHWVQTPYRYFPVEPHWLCPGMQFLPLRARATLTRRWPLSPARASTVAEAVENAASVELLSLTEMRFYFPSSQIWYERIGGLVKSVTAIRS